MLHPTACQPHKQRRITKHATTTDCFSIFNILTSDALLEQVELLSPEHRERNFTPTTTLSMFVSQALSADRSCQNIVDQHALKQALGGLSPCSTGTAAYCNARQRLPLNMIRGLARHIGDHVETHSPSDWRLNGRRVRVVDGTTVTMPDTTENQEDFPQQGGQKPGLGFPICRVVGVTDLFSGLLVNAAIGQFSGKDSGEQSLLRELLPSFEAGDIILGDAFFPTWFFMANMLANGVDILMEQQGARKRSTDFRTGKKLGVRDHLIVLTKPVIQPSWMTRAQYESYSDAITVRELKANKKTMVTTMLCPAAMPKAVLADLYKRRWHVEVDIRCIKDTLGMNILSCKTPEMVIKEIWTYLLAYNLIRLIMAQSALMGDIAPRQISFKHSVQLWLAWLQQAGTWEDEKLIILCELIVQQQVGRRPGRLEPRAVKRRPKAYPLLMKPRAEAREDVRKFGHAKKLK